MAMKKQDSAASNQPISEKRTDCCSTFCSKINRTKTLNPDVMSTPLSRCLTTGDLTFLGIGYMIGPGIYIVTGTVIHSIAGAGAIFSYTIAGLAAFLSAICYAECGSRIPSAGSAYAFTYVSVGEISAFVVGWNMLLEYLIVVASGAKAWSSALDALCNRQISMKLTALMGFPDIQAIAPFPDFVAVGVIIVAMLFILTGARTSLTFNNILSVIVIVSIIVVIGAGFSKSDVQIWTNSTYGGFLPYGIGGVFQASATCFYSYLGFDGIAVAAEEAINPKEALPWAIGISMLTVTILYVLATTALTLMVPYMYIDILAPYTIAFEQVGLYWEKYVVSFGSIIAISTTITGGIYFLPRVAYAMASDGLICSIFGRVNATTQIPAVGTIILGAMASILALFISLEVLVLLMSIGTLISFTFVAACVILLRFEIPNQSADSEDVAQLTKAESNEKEDDEENKKRDDELIPGYSWFGLRKRFLNSETFKSCDQGRLTVFLLFLIVAATMCTVITIVYAEMTHWTAIIITVFVIIILSSSVTLSMMTQRMNHNIFQVPLVPFFPILTICCNLTMILLLDALTWVRLVVWTTLGFILYFSYGLHHSKEKKVHTAANLEMKTYGSLNNSSTENINDSYKVLSPD